MFFRQFCAAGNVLLLYPLCFFALLSMRFHRNASGKLSNSGHKIYDPGVGRVCPLRIDHSCLSAAIGLMWSPLYLRYMICQPTPSCTVFRMESKRGNLRGSDYDSAAGLLAFSL